MSPERTPFQPPSLLAKDLFSKLIATQKWELYKPLTRDATISTSKLPQEIVDLFKFVSGLSDQSIVEASVEARRKSTNNFFGSLKFYSSSNKNLGIEIRIVTNVKKQKNKIYVGIFRRKTIQGVVHETFRTRKIPPGNRTSVAKFVEHGLPSLFPFFPRRTKTIPGGW